MYFLKFNCIIMNYCPKNFHFSSCFYYFISNILPRRLKHGNFKLRLLELCFTNS